jgi:hypothetical protein
MWLRFLPLLLLVTLSVPACDDDTTVTTPTSTTTTTDTFSGTLTVNGGTTWQFSSTGRGTLTATLTSVGPDSAAVIGVSVGTWNGTSCQILLANDQATTGSTVIGQVSGVGNLCLRVYDPGTLTAPATYSVNVAHP